MDNLQSFAAGSYQSGSFLLRYYLKDFPYEDVLFSPMYVGDVNLNNYYSETKGGYLTTNRVLTYLHEGNHYMQDLSLPACLSEDYHYDEMSMLVHAAIDVGCDSFPLMQQKHLKCKWMPVIFYNIQIHNLLFKTSHIKSENKKYASLFEDSYFQQIARERGLSYSDLLEGYVHYISLVHLADRAILSGKQEYIHKFKDRFNLFPYIYNEDEHNLDFSQALQGNSYTYHIARILFLVKNKGFNIDGALKHLQREWPKGYRDTENPLAFLDCAFFFLLDIALNIPAVAYIRGLCDDGKYQIEDFSPVHRFLSELKVIEDNHGFPEPVENEPYYITLFDFFSQKLNWLSYANTLKSWDIFLRRVEEPNSDTSMGYRRRMFWSKNTKFHKFFLQEPSFQMRQTNIPLICITKGGKVKIVKKYGNLEMPYEGIIDVYGMFKMPYHPWKEYGEELNNSVEWVKIENNNAESLLREIIYRTISRNIQDAILYRNNFTCVFYNSEYDKAIQANSDFDTSLPAEIHCKAMNRCKCCNVTDFSELPECGCAVRDYLKLMKYNTHNKQWR